MAKTKAGGRAEQKTPRKGRRLGVKLFSGEVVMPGQIIVRQRGSQFHPGEGVKMGRDFTLYSTVEGSVQYKQRKGEKIVSVKV